MWGCGTKKEAVEQLKYVKEQLGYTDAFINEYVRELDFYGAED